VPGGDDEDRLVKEEDWKFWPEQLGGTNNRIGVAINKNS
jgi:hypothetical protein